jgi:uncharacterized protein involved in exopolysaccharide biosynthesis
MMDESLVPVEFIHYVRDKRIVFAISCTVAMAMALTISLLLPKRYTAKASILIEAPAGNDPRAATAVSQVYLESLKTYESFASSDTLFLRALDYLHERELTSNTPIESLKRRVLKVSKPASTTILEISATLTDPRKAQSMAQYIAEQTVELSRSLEGQSSDGLIKEFRSESEAALERLKQARAARSAFAISSPIDTLENETRQLTELQYRLEKDLADARTDLADFTAQRQALETGQHSAQDAEWVQGRFASAQARVSSIENQRRESTELLAKKGSQLEARKISRDGLDDDVRAAATAYELTRTRLNEMLSSSQFRGERLHVIDPGIVPQRPGSPDIPLNVLAALLASLVASFIYLALRFSYGRLLRERSAREYSLR